MLYCLALLEGSWIIMKWGYSTQLHSTMYHCFLPGRVGLVQEGWVAHKLEENQYPHEKVLLCFSGGFKLEWQGAGNQSSRTSMGVHYLISKCTATCLTAQQHNRALNWLNKPFMVSGNSTPPTILHLLHPISCFTDSACLSFTSLQFI